MKSRTVVKPKFTTDFPEAVVREGADQLRLRAEKEGMLHTFIDTTDVGESRRGPPLVGVDWHAICQAIFQGRRLRMGDHEQQLEGAAQSGQM